MAKKGDLDNKQYVYIPFKVSHTAYACTFLEG